MSIQNVHETNFCKWQIDLLQSYITFILARLFSKFKITTVVRIDNKTLDKLIETWQLIFLKIIFNVLTKPINYMRSHLNTLVVYNIGVLKYPPSLPDIFQFMGVATFCLLGFWNILSPKFIRILSYIKSLCIISCTKLF